MLGNKLFLKAEISYSIFVEGRFNHHLEDKSSHNTKKYGRIVKPVPYVQQFAKQNLLSNQINQETKYSIAKKLQTNIAIYPLLEKTEEDLFQKIKMIDKLLKNQKTIIIKNNSLYVSNLDGIKGLPYIAVSNIEQKTTQTRKKNTEDQTINHIALGDKKLILSKQINSKEDIFSYSQHFDEFSSIYTIEDLSSFISNLESFVKTIKNLDKTLQIDIKTSNIIFKLKDNHNMDSLLNNNNPFEFLQNNHIAFSSISGVIGVAISINSDGIYTKEKDDFYKQTTPKAYYFIISTNVLKYLYINNKMHKSDLERSFNTSFGIHRSTLGFEISIDIPFIYKYVSNYYNIKNILNPPKEEGEKTGWAKIKESLGKFICDCIGLLGLLRGIILGLTVNIKGFYLIISYDFVYGCFVIAIRRSIFSITEKPENNINKESTQEDMFAYI